MTDDKPALYHLVLDGQRLGPYDERTLVGMRIKDTLSAEQWLEVSDGSRITLGELIAQRHVRTTGFRVSGQPQIYPVFEVQYVGPRKACFGFSGWGEARVQPDVLRLAGTVRRWTGSSREARVKIPMDCLREVALFGSEVVISLSDDAPFEPAVRRQRVRLAARSPELAQELHALISRAPRVADVSEAALPSTPPLTTFSGWKPWVTWALMAANVLAFGAVVLAGSAWGQLLQLDGELLVRSGSNFGPLTRDGQVWRLLSAMFLHGGLVHLALNMYALWDLGQLTERLLGRVKLALLYLASGLMGGVVSLWWNPWVNSVGASGAIFGVVGVLMVYMAVRGNRVPLVVMRSHLVSLSAMLGYAVILGATQKGIDNAAHAGGLLMGLLGGMAISRLTPWWTRLWGLGLRVVVAIVTIGLGFVLWSYTPNRGPAWRADKAFEQEWHVLQEDQPRLSRAIAEMGALEKRVGTDPSAREQLLEALRRHVMYWQDSINRFSAMRLPADARTLMAQTALLHYSQGQHDMGSTAIMLLAFGDNPELQGKLAQAKAQTREGAAQLKAAMDELARGRP